MKRLLAALVIGLVSTQANAADIISENFESGLGVFSATGAAGIANGYIYQPCCFTTGSSANLSNQFVAFGGGDQPSGLISSPINLVTGTSYTLDFDFRALGPAQGETIYAVINGLTFGFSTLTNNNLDLPYQHGTITFVASGPTTTLQFYSSGLASVDGIVDNVLLSGLVAPVPEPATWAMMLLGFGGVGMAIRRRRHPVLAQVA